MQASPVYWGPRGTLRRADFEALVEAEEAVQLAEKVGVEVAPRLKEEIRRRRDLPRPSP